MIQKPKETGGEVARSLWQSIYGNISKWVILIQNNQEYLLNMVKGVDQTLKDMKLFYAKRKLKKDIEVLYKADKDIKDSMEKLSARIKSLGKFIEKINFTFNERVKTMKLE